MTPAATLVFRLQSGDSCRDMLTDTQSFKETNQMRHPHSYSKHILVLIKTFKVTENHK